MKNQYKPNRIKGELSDLYWNFYLACSVTKGYDIFVRSADFIPMDLYRLSDSLNSGNLFLKGGLALEELRSLQ